MRLDKYLKVARIIKRRTVANEACDAAHVTANGRPAKASYDVKVGASPSPQLCAMKAQAGAQRAHFSFPLPRPASTVSSLLQA